MSVNIRPSLAAVLVGSKEELIERAKRFDEVLPMVCGMVSRYERLHKLNTCLLWVTVVVLGISVLLSPTIVVGALYLCAVGFCFMLERRFNNAVKRERDNRDELLAFRRQLDVGIAKS